MSKRFIFLLALLTCSFTGFSQKVKYKDLFVLLNAKQYDQAFPFLRRYLKENDDNPNAYLFMGFIYQDKAVATDVLKQTDRLNVFIDSAIFYYDKADKGLTEKEISRNEEYYQAYNRRDLRTGKFGVTLSDVQFDVEKRIKALKEKKANVKTLNEHYERAEELYEKAHFIFMGIENAYPGSKELYLRADDKLVQELKLLITRFDSTVLVFNEYKATSLLVGKTGYNQVLNLQPISDFKKDGVAIITDFTKDDLRVWDYKKWAEQTLEIVQKDIVTLNAHWVAFDVEINKLRDQVRKDSVSVRSELRKFDAKLQDAQLKKYDRNPLPLSVLMMKAAELEYASSVISNKPSVDSVNVIKRIAGLSTEIKAAKKLDSLSALLEARHWSDESKDYASFITSAYGTTPVLENLIKSTREFAIKEHAKRTSELDKKIKSLNWLVDASDSIPLVMESATAKFKPLVITKEAFTLGLSLKDTEMKGYFYTITPSRKPETRVSLPLDKVAFTKTNLPITRGLATYDAKSQVYVMVICSEAKSAEKFPVVISRIGVPEGLNWSMPFKFDLLPSEVTYNPGTGETTVKSTAPSGESQLIVIDKSGKQVTQ